MSNKQLTIHDDYTGNWMMSFFKGDDEEDFVEIRCSDLEGYWTIDIKEAKQLQLFLRRLLDNHKDEALV